MRNLTNVEGMSLEVLRAGIRWEFETVPEYLAMLERNGAALNLAAFVGHSSVRTFVMREDAARRAATAAEIEAMRTLVAEGMHAGAIGFATSTSPAHNGDGGIPMPSRLADDAELLALTGRAWRSRRLHADQGWSHQGELPRGGGRAESAGRWSSRRSFTTI